MQTKKQSPLSKEIEEFHAKIRARALLIAVEWAHGAGPLAELVGLSRYTGIKWVARGRISTVAALKLVKIKGFPLSIDELCLGVQFERYKSRQCPRCDAVIHPPHTRPGCSPLLKVVRKRTARKRLAKHKQQAAKRES